MFPKGFDTRKDKTIFVLVMVAYFIFCIAAASALLWVGGWLLAAGMGYTFGLDMTPLQGVGVIAMAYLLTFFVKLGFK